MLHMGNKILKIVFLFQIILVKSFAGHQTVDIGLALSSNTMSQHSIGDKMVIDLGYLEEGKSYVGQNKIEIGTVTVKISQTRTSEDDSTGCFLNGIEFDSVNLRELVKYNQTISTKVKNYVGKSPRIILTAGEIGRITADGNLNPDENIYLFVAKECLTNKDFEGFALTNLEYDFKMYAEIESPVSKGNVTGSFAEESNGVVLSIKDIIKEQISSAATPFRRGKRR